MDGAVTIILAGEPRGQGRPRFRAVTTKDGRRFNSTYKDGETEKYEAALRSRGQDAMSGRPPMDGPVRVTIFAAFPIPQSWSQKKQREALAGILRPTVKPDCDNVFKMLDALNMVVFVDDKQIVEALIRKVYSDRPRLEVTVEPVLIRVALPEPAEAPEAPLFREVVG